MQKTIPDTVIVDIKETKKCPKCGIKKLLSDFNKHKWCRVCSNQASLDWYYKNKEITCVRSKLWKKNHPEFYQSKEFKEAQSVREKKWYEKNSEHRKEVGRKYYENNKEKFKEAIYRRKSKIKNNGGNFTWEEFLNLCKQYKYRCLACGKNNIKLTPDHVVPLFVGGINAIKNIQPLCLHCNISKGIKIIDYREVMHD